MQILLTAVNAKYIHSCPAVYSLRAAAGGEGISIAEYTVNDRYQDILSDLVSRRPDAAGFSCYIWNTRLMQDLIRDVRKILGPDTLLFAGGPEATWNPEPYLGEERCDFVLRGEGEIPFRMLAEQLRHGGRDGWRSIPGVLYRSGQTLRGVPAVPETGADIDRIPFLYDGLDRFRDRIIYYESSRGCPFHCSYCLSSVEETVRFRNLETVKRELQYFLDQKVRQIKFVDRTFNCNPDRAESIWRFLKEHDNGITNFHFEVGADLLTERQLRLLSSMRPALIQLEIGIQTTNPDAIRAIRRTTDLKKLGHAVRYLHRAGNINLHVDLIAGLPYEDYDSFGRSFNDVYPLGADMLQLGFLKVLRGTEMHRKAEAYGIRWSERPPYEVLATKWLGYGELSRLQKIADVLDLYYNSRQFIRSLNYLVPHFPDPFHMYESLAAFYGGRGYFKMKLPAAKQYEVLELFAENMRADGICSMTEEESRIFREYLRFDWALHHHASRRMQTEETFDFGEGPVRIRFDHSRKNPVNGEAEQMQEKPRIRNRKEGKAGL